MQMKLATAALLGLVLVAVAACISGGDEDRLTMERDAALEAAEKAKEAAEAAQKAAEEAAKKAAEEKKAREDAEKKVADDADAEAARQAELEAAKKAQEEAERKAREAEEEAKRQIEEAARQAETTLRATQYMTALAGGSEATTAFIAYERDKRLQVYPGQTMRSGIGAPSISGFTAHSFVDDADTAYIYTNIQAPGTRPFWKVYGLEVTAAQDDAEQSPTPTAAPTADNTDTPVTTTVRGTYHGVSGTYTCQSTNCAGDVEFVSGTSGPRRFVASPSFVWDFEPGSIATGVRQNHDTEYLYFGIWLTEPDDANTAHTYRYIVGGDNDRTTDGVPLVYSELDGTYTFRGGAVGKYATRNQVNQNDKVGTFTADVELTAILGTTHPDTAAQNTVSGLIDNFRDGGQDLGSGWQVRLNRSGIVDGVVASTSTTAAKIGGVNATGTWGATLHGSDNNNLGGTERDSVKYPLSRYPTADLSGIVGHFSAANGTSATDRTVAIAGAFAATPRN